MPRRVLSVLAAFFLVLSVALATFGPRQIVLGQALLWVDKDVPEGLHRWLDLTLGAWAWSSVILPLFARPVWLVPTSLALICGGLALSLSGRKSTHRSHRRS